MSDAAANATVVFRYPTTATEAVKKFNSRTYNHNRGYETITTQSITNLY